MGEQMKDRDASVRETFEDVISGMTTEELDVFIDLLFERGLLRKKPYHPKSAADLGKSPGRS